MGIRTRVFLVSTLVACLVDVAVAQQQNFEHQRTLIKWSEPGNQDQAFEIVNSIWVAGVLENVWAVDIDGKKVLSLSFPSAPPDPGPVVTSSQEDGYRKSVVTRQIVRVSAQPVIKTWSLPKEYTYGSLWDRHILLAPVDSNSVWIIDRDIRLVWLLANGKWIGPWEVADTIGWVCATRQGLYINTPEHTDYAFAALDSNGKVKQRFGTRSQAAGAVMTSLMNTWYLAQLANGDLVAVNQYQKMIRCYAANGKLRWEQTPDLPILRRIEEVHQKRQLEQSSVSGTRLPAYSSGVTGDGEKGFLVRYGVSSSLEQFDLMGDWQGSVAVETGKDMPWLTAGFAKVDEHLIAAELSGLVEYGTEGTDTSGQVVDTDGFPVKGALVSVDLDGGIIYETESDGAGKFSYFGIPSDVASKISVNADRFHSFQDSGLLADLVAQPIVLEPALEQCVRVVDGETRAPVARYMLRLHSKKMTPSSVSLGEGAGIDIEDPEGYGCLSVEWEPPWLIQIEADGYAIAEARVERIETVEIPLLPEALLKLEIQSDDGAPVSGTVVMIEPAARPEGSTAYLAHQLATSGEDGIAELCGLSEGTYRVSFLHPEYLQHEEEIPVEIGMNNHQVTLDRGLIVDIMVTDQEDRPIAGASAVVYRFSCTTAEDGSCRVNGVPRVSFDVTAEAEGFISGSAPLEINPGQDLYQATVSLNRGVRVDGIVVGHKDYGHTRLVVALERPGMPKRKALVGAGGDFVIDGLPAGQVNAWVLPEGDCAKLLFEPITVPEGVSAYSIELVLPPAIHLWGRVTRGERSCSSCAIEMRQQSAEICPAAGEAWTAADGSYRLHLPFPGKYSVSINDHDTGARYNNTLDLLADQEVSFNLDQAVLRGVVLSKDGEPAGDAGVQLFSHRSGSVIAETLTGALGSFELKGLPAGSFTVTAWLGGAAATEALELPAIGVEDIELTLSEEDVLILKLVDAEAGHLLDGSRVMLLTASGELARYPYLSSDRDGNTSIPTFGSPPWIAVLSVAGYGLKTVRNLWPSATPQTAYLSPGQGGFIIEVGSEVGLPRALSLLDNDTLPVALSIDIPPGPIPFSARRASFSCLEPGMYTAVLHTTDDQQYTQPLVLSQGSQPHIVFPNPNG
jgi:hypothetical protein